MAQIHLTMGSKGGIGKTMIAANLAQYLTAKGANPCCIDLDFKNQSFCLYKGLKVFPLDLETDGDIEKRKFDVLIDRFGAAGEDDVFVVDCGGNIYIPLNNYMLSNDVYGVVFEMGHSLRLHVPVMGGSELDETMKTLLEVCQGTPDECRVAVWLNTYHGVIEKDGKSFEQSEVYKACKKRLYTIVAIPHMADDMRRDVSEMFKQKMTYAECMESPAFNIMPRQRIKMAMRKMFDVMAASMVCAGA